jgi:hypothetical protein
MFLTFLDHEAQLVDIKVTDIAMCQQQRGTYQGPGQVGVEYILGTRITLTSGVDVWVTATIFEVRKRVGYDVQLPDPGTPSSTAFSVKVRGTGK